MEKFSKGQRSPMANIAPSGSVHMGVRAEGPALDFSCYGLTADGKLASDDYMTFFNQPATPCGGARMEAGQGELAGFTFELSRFPAHVERVVVAASLDGAGSMSQLGSSSLRLSSQGLDKAEYAFNGSDFTTERALMLGEFYRKDGQWRFMVVGQGFAGGLDALARHFGADVGDAQATQASPSVSAKVLLEKRIAAEAPQLVSLVKKAAISLEKVGLQNHKAKVCLCLDISISMQSLYDKGLVQQLSERILALGCSFDDDGEIDVFLFGRNVHQPDPMGLANCQSYVNGVTRKFALEGGTYYGKAMKEIRSFYFPDGNGGPRSAPRREEVPVYVMFVTDGETADKDDTIKQLRWSSHEPIFWQFMGIGASNKNKKPGFLGSLLSSNFEFLESLDELDGRLVDNANFFSVEKPGEGSDDELYRLLMEEYPDWLKKARIHGMLPDGPRPADAPKPRP